MLVTGASGRTGRLVFSRLINDRRYEPKALVRSERCAKRLIKSVKGVELDQIIICDVTTMEEAMSIPCCGLKGASAMIMCTSAVGQVRVLSLIKVLLKIPFNLARRKQLMNFRDLRFRWKHNQPPEKVDYEGQLAQIDFAKKLDIQQVVMVSSMGGTDPNNFLNSVGKKSDGTGDGDILIWKRKAEEYLIQSGLDYTIIHPGGLNDKESGIEAFVLDVDDKLLKSEKRSISREDLADLCVGSLTTCKGKKVAFDCVTATVNLCEKPPKNAEEAILEFLETGKTCNYSL